MLIETATKAFQKSIANQTSQMQLKSTAGTQLKGAPVKGESHRRRQPTNKLVLEQALGDWRKKVVKAQNRWPGERRFHNQLWRIRNQRELFLRDFPEDSQKKWVYNVMALA